MHTTNIHTLPAATANLPATVTNVQRAMRDGMSSAALLAAANWNERRGYDERRRKARARHKGQAVALRKVAGLLDAVEMGEAA